MRQQRGVDPLTSATWARVVETHISSLVFVGDRVLKFRKPVRTAFLDLSTLEARRRDCEREVSLNRRLAPDVYEGVASLSLGGHDIDYAVVMQRLPDEAQLAHIVARRPVEAWVEIDRVAERLAEFHRSAAVAREVAEGSTAGRVLARWEANLDEIIALGPSPRLASAVGAVSDLAHRYVRGRRGLFEDRINEGRIVDGHGDLLAADVFCLPDGPRLLDCLQFDDDLRIGDGLADVAFLAMDLEHLGRGDMAQAFLEAYRAASGDDWPASLAHHYIAYRAVIRAKVALLRADQEAASDLLDLALRHLEQGTVRVVLVGGPPGTGKSTLAAKLGQTLGWPVVRSDVVRKELAGLAPEARASAPLATDLYDPANTVATYRALLVRAAILVGRGQSVVLDARWPTEALRRRARQQATDQGADVIELRCELPGDVAIDRIRARQAEGADASDATEEVARALRRVTEPWPTAFVIDTTIEPDVCLWRALHFIEDRATERSLYLRTA